MKIYNVYDVRKDKTAWSKAPADVVSIISRLPNVINKPYETPSFSGFWSLQLARLKRVYIDLKLIYSIARKSILILQLPGLFLSGGLGVFLIATLHFLKKVRIIVVVHDLECIRKNGLGCKPDVQLRAIIKWSSVIVAHNESMAGVLRRFGARDDKIVKLEIFDYLLGDDNFRVQRKLTNLVAIAGNLNADKAKYLSHLGAVTSVEWKLFGNGYDRTKIQGANIQYIGSFNPEELPNKFNQSFGLVWDGDSTDTCSGPFGEYLRVNNPHKLSLYLASGLPVIIWSQAAEAQFVVDKGVGVLVDSLTDVPKMLASITEDQYRNLVDGACRMSAKLRRGDFFSEAFNKSLAIVDPCQ
jgi:hypothetical protein